MELTAPIRLLIPPPPLRVTAPPIPFPLRRPPRRLRRRPLAAATERNLEPSWIAGDENLDDGVGGWSVAVSAREAQKRTGVPKMVVIGAGAAVAALLAAFAYRSTKGFKIQLDAPFQTLSELLQPSKHSNNLGEDRELPGSAVDGFSKDEQDEKVDVGGPILKEDNLVSGESKRVIVPVAPDSTQEEALLLLKKLKIIENDTNADELCTRREYARWLVNTNSMLERNPKYRILPLRSFDRSVASAFDDVSVNDPDFWCIQALGEAGIVLSKLSAENFPSSTDVSKIDGHRKVEFCPDGFITRFDMVNWKALLEYSSTTKMNDKSRC